MLKKTPLEILNAHFQESVNTLDRTIKRAQLVRKIGLKSRQSETASPEDLVKILADLKSYRKMIRQLE